MSTSLWRTADNKLIPFSEITHQHWSNIYWYHLIFQMKPGMPASIMKNTVLMALEHIEEKFDGVILPWEPIFEFEVSWLSQLRLLRNEKDIFDFYGIKIGTISTKPLIVIPDVWKA